MTALARLKLPAASDEPPRVPTGAAVAVIFGPGDELLFIRRAERPGDPWSGDMAFPGGRLDTCDRSPRECAQRETREEIGLDLVEAEYLGALPVKHTPLRDPQFGFGIAPFVYRVRSWPIFSTSEEVAAVHRFPLARFLANEGRGEFRYRGYGIERDLPCVRLEGRMIWGLTLRMLDDLLARLDAGP